MKATDQSRDVAARNAVPSHAAGGRPVRWRRRSAIGRGIASFALLAVLTILLATLSAICIGALTTRVSAPAEADGIAGIVRGSLSVPARERGASLIA